MLLATSMQMMPDKSVVVLLGIFLCAVALLSVFVFRPVLRIMDRRRELTDDVVDRAREVEQTAEELDARMEDGFEKARTEGAKLREELRREAKESVRTMIEEGRAERDLILARARSDQVRLREQMLNELYASIGPLSELAAAHALIREKEGS